MDEDVALQILADLCGSESVEALDLEARLVDDLGFDSILMFEVFLTIEAVFEGELPIYIFDDLSTVGDAARYVRLYSGHKEGNSP